MVKFDVDVRISKLVTTDCKDSLRAISWSEDISCMGCQLSIGVKLCLSILG